MHGLVCQRVASVQNTIILAYDAIPYGLARRDPTAQTSPAARSACPSGDESAIRTAHNRITQPASFATNHPLLTINASPSSVQCPVSSVQCPLSSVFCLPSSAFRLLPTVDQPHVLPATTHPLIPSTSHYHANMPKSAKKRNTAKTQLQPQPQLQPLPLLPSSPLSAPVPPSPATTVNSGPKPLVPPITTIDFAFFLQHASPEDLEHFLALASTTQEGRNLKFLWRRAFLEGEKQGIDKAKSATDLQLRNANLDGFQDGYNEGRDSVEDRLQCYEDQIAVALQDERSKWKGHGETCFKLPISPSTRDSAVQSDPICLPATASSSTQTPLIPPPLPNSATMGDLPPKKLSWADDVALSLPIITSPPLPRDLSCLRSEKVHPFGALRQRDRRTHRQPQLRKP